MKPPTLLKRTAVLAVLFLIIFLFANQVVAQPQTEYTVTITLDEAWSKTNADGSGDDDIYWRVLMKPLKGSGLNTNCGNEDMNISGETHIKPGWTCTGKVTGGQDTAVQITLMLWESDAWFTGTDDVFDIHPAQGSRDLTMIYKPHNNNLVINNISDWSAPGRCSHGGIVQEGNHGSDQARVKFSVSSDKNGSPTGDADKDGLLNNWEICGYNTDNDNEIEVDLPGMGADPLHKDLFVEIDWMIDDSGNADDHSHEPWLPSLLNAWHEFDQAHVTNPDGTNGINLHLDVGNLYEDYSLDFNNDGTNEIDVGANGIDLDNDGTSESLDVDNDGTADIGFLGRMGTGTKGGGNRVPGNEDPVLDPAPGKNVCDANADLLKLRGSQFDAYREDTFRWSLFGHRHSSAASTSSGVACWGGETYAVTLSGWGRETGITGPSGLPVDGRIEEHTGTFMHELGHTLSIGHGGDDSVNYKPNYLSLMNYHFQMTGINYSFDGDLLADAIVGQDYDHDGQDDLQRFMFSQQKLPTLDEGSLNEATGIGDASALTRYGPAGMDTNGDNICDLFCGQIFQWQLGNRAIDFSRGDHDNDGTLNNDTGVNRLTAPPNPANTIIDLNWDNNQSKLDGYNDMTKLKNGALAVGGSGLSSAGSDHAEVTLPQLEFLELHTSGVTPMPDEAFVNKRCESDYLHKIDFENLPAGTTVTNQYAPLATFSSTMGTPLIAGSAYRSGRPAQSPAHSLVNDSSAATPGPLRITFGEPQRIVGLYLGRSEPAGSAYDYARLTAYDTNGDVLGSVTRELPGVNQGITAFLGAGAVFEERSIASIELENLGGATFEPAHIDDLLFCEDKKEDAEPKFPEPPKFGELPVTVKVHAGLVTVGPPNKEHAEPLVHTPLTHLPVEVDGKIDLTNFSFSRFEGDRITVAAPPIFDLAGTPLIFLHWVMDDKIIFPDEQEAISLTILQDAALKAVYTTEADGCRFIVDSTADATDLSTGDGQCRSGGNACTLRAAVQQANALQDACLITLPTGNYKLTRTGQGEEGAVNGDLDIHGQLAILGAGARETFVNGSKLDTVFDVHDARAAILGLTIHNGGKAGYPGGVHNKGDLSLGACGVSSNESPAWIGGAIHNSGRLIIIDCELAYNEAMSGGAIFNSGELTVLRSLIHHNEALEGDGGGIANYMGGEAHLDQTALLFNASALEGGGIWNGYHMHIFNSTISENTAVSGGGLFNEQELHLNNVTVAANNAPNNIGGGLHNFSGDVIAGNSLFAANTDEGSTAPDCLGELYSLGHNLIENGGGCLILGDTTGNQVNVAAQIAPLAYAGGSTSAGHALLASSPARDAANPAAPGDGPPACQARDQVGVTRPQNGRCDIGALEMPGKSEPKDALQPPGTPDGQQYQIFLPTIK